MNQDLKNMRLAIKMASNAGSDCPIGCVIAKGDLVLSARHNEVMADSDPTAHAEILCIKEACDKLNSRYLTAYTMYCTLEPCPMCLEAINLAKVGSVIFGAFRPQGEEMNPPMIGGILEPECRALLDKFFADLRR